MRSPKILLRALSLIALASESDSDSSESNSESSESENDTLETHFCEKSLKVLKSLE
jgi:hypothetical protein